MSNRTIRVNELLMRELNDILRRQHQAEAMAITVTEVRVAPDLRDARVFVAVMGSPELAEEKLLWLRRNASSIRGAVAKRIVLKYIPRITYVLDKTAERSARLHTLLDEMPPAAPEPEAET